ncbi:MAG TPA: MerR family transcriptional regulator [Chitinophagaceae bacterium]|nr:MerR family transcriptional regulator [Chitinophagaceae bacterium]
MAKNLPQIAFDFSAPTGPETPASQPLVETASPSRLPEITTDPVAGQPAPPPEAAPRRERERSGPVSTRGRRSLKEIALEADLVQVPEDEILFQKQYYSIGEVAGWFRVNQSLLRYWESEFDILQPRKNRKGDRFFRPVDIKHLQLIYDLLRRRKFTIEGAKEYMKNSRRAEEKFSMIQSLEKIKAFLQELKASL